MDIASLSWRDYLVFISFVASIAGLLLIPSGKQTQAEDFEEIERSLFQMSFTYWLVYCVAFGLLKLKLPEWEMLLVSLKLTVVFSYLLTFCCILALPLHRISKQYAAK
jgi:hypothetical protein